MVAQPCPSRWNEYRPAQSAKEKDEARRKVVTDTIEKIYNETRQTVENKLASLETDVSALFDKGIEAAMTKMTDYINVLQFDNADKKENKLTWYLKAQLLDILKWWQGNALEYSTLARIAIDIFSISAMSVESEWVFNGYTSKKELLINSKMQVDFNGWKKSAADRYCWSSGMSTQMDSWQGVIRRFQRLESMRGLRGIIEAINWYSSFEEFLIE